MQQGCRQSGGIELEPGQYQRRLERVFDKRLAGLAELSLMCLGGIPVRLLHHHQLLSRQVFLRPLLELTKTGCLDGSHRENLSTLRSLLV